MGLFTFYSVEDARKFMESNDIKRWGEFDLEFNQIKKKTNCSAKNKDIDYLFN